jgi:hypothetical protein
MIMGKLLSKDRSISVAVDSYINNISSFFGHQKSQKIYSYPSDNPKPGGFVPYPQIFGRVIPVYRLFGYTPRYLSYT